MRPFVQGFAAIALLGVSLVAESAPTTAEFIPSTAPAGARVEFAWRGFTGATRCRIFGVPGLEQSLQVGGRIAFTATQNLDATVFCSKSPPSFDPGNEATARFTIDSGVILPPAIDAFYSFFPEDGESVSLAVFADRADSCRVQDIFGLDLTIGPVGSVLAGFVPGFFAADVTCVGPGGSTTVSVSVFAFADPSGVAATGDFTAERDLDRDGKLERVTFDAKQQRLRIESRNSTGHYETVKVMEGVRGMEQIQGIEVRRGLDGKPQINVRKRQ